MLLVYQIKEIIGRGKGANFSTKPRHSVVMLLLGNYFYPLQKLSYVNYPIWPPYWVKNEDNRINQFGNIN